MTYGFVNLKGGVGKTSMTLSFADYLATPKFKRDQNGKLLSIPGKRVLVVDADPQGNTTSILLEDRLSDTGNPLRNDETIWNTVVDGGELVIHKTNKPNVSLVANNVSMFGGIITISRQSDSLGNGKHTRLKVQLEKVKEFYDYILIDFCPSMNPLSEMAFTACDECVVVSKPGKFETDGIREVKNVIHRMQADYNPQLKIKGILFNMIEMHRNATVDTINKARAEFNDLDIFNFETVEKDENNEEKKITIYGVPLNSDMQNSQMKSRSIFDHNKHSKSAKAVAAIADKHFND